MDEAKRISLPYEAEDIAISSATHHPPCHSEDITTLLEETAQCVKGIGYDFTDLLGTLEGLKTRLIEGQSHLAVLRQFERGKSSLINALLGKAVLPTAVIPLTSIPTFIRFGHELRARISYANSKGDHD
jgi:hypothetical protein